MKLTEIRSFNDIINSENFKAWFGDWETYPQHASKVRDENGKPLVVYHGTQRPDRVGYKFDPKRATSGPMQYFTSDPEVASNYAKGKKDNSIGTEEDYADRFRFKPKELRKTINVKDYWWYLPVDQKKKVQELAPLISDEEGNIHIGDGLTSLSHFNEVLRVCKGNYLAALCELWLNSGQLYDEEEKFLEVLNLIGIKDVIYEDPHASYPAVFATFLNIRTPLRTSEITDVIKKEIIKAGIRKRGNLNVDYSDQWDKRNKDPREWIEDLKNGNEYVWTCIPDWVTDVLRKLGFDGIIDTGNKSGTGKDHYVYIPFRPNQIKSIWAKTYSWDSDKIHEKLEEQGIELKRIKRFKTDEGWFSVWDIDDDHRNRGDMFTVHERPKGGWIIRNALIPEDLRRQKIGLQFHIQMNNLSKAKTGYPLRTVIPRPLPDGRMVLEFSDMAEKLWDYMVKNGLAVKHGYKDYSMI